jgi:AraC family transcriptional regulator of adaptative response/methylated-DNA-[protein]-cysteine methyltransferase
MSKLTPTSHPKIEAQPVPSFFPGRQWQQVLERDATADGQFFYAVKSTKVYCRPSCPSRRPTKKNVSFFPTSAAAEAAGFRACKRCEPDLATPRPDPQAAVIAAATEYLTEHAAERTKLTDLAKATGVGRLTILRGFRRVLGVSPGEFAKAQRVARFKDALRPAADKPAATRERPASSPKRITDAIYDAGFGSSSRLYESSANSLGMTPRVMREGGAGLVIRYATAPSPLGRMLVAATPTGICAIAFGRDDAELTADLRQRFNSSPPRATPVGSPMPSPSSPARPPSIRSQQPFRSTSARPPSSSACGRPCSRFLAVRPAATPSSPANSASPPPPEP